MTSSIFTAESFWTTFASDLENACAHVIVQSPFVHERRLNYLAGFFSRALRRGVTICIYIKRPRDWL